MFIGGVCILIKGNKFEGPDYQHLLWIWAVYRGNGLEYDYDNDNDNGIMESVVMGCASHGHEI